MTVQSNFGLDQATAKAGGQVVRTQIGDRYVAARMRSGGYTLGGESSGHIVCSDVSPTGDGLVAAIKVVQVMLETKQTLSQLREGAEEISREATGRREGRKTKRTQSGQRPFGPKSCAEVEIPIGEGGAAFSCITPAPEPILRFAWSRRRQMKARESGGFRV